MAVQPGLCRTWLVTPQDQFSHDKAQVISKIVMEKYANLFADYHETPTLIRKFGVDPWKDKANYMLTFFIIQL